MWCARQLMNASHAPTTFVPEAQILLLQSSYLFNTGALEHHKHKAASQHQTNWKHINIIYLQGFSGPNPWAKQADRVLVSACAHLESCHLHTSSLKLLQWSIINNMMITVAEAPGPYKSLWSGYHDIWSLCICANHFQERVRCTNPCIWHMRIRCIDQRCRVHGFVHLILPSRCIFSAP